LRRVSTARKRIAASRKKLTMHGASLPPCIASHIQENYLAKAAAQLSAAIVDLSVFNHLRPLATSRSILRRGPCPGYFALKSACNCRVVLSVRRDRSGGRTETWRQVGRATAQCKIKLTRRSRTRSAASRVSCRRAQSLTRCADCDAEIPEARRIAIPGVRLCVACQHRARSRRREVQRLQSARQQRQPAALSPARACGGFLRANSAL
jgi:RNA polymerase-binding transcription factor DksA